MNARTHLGLGLVALLAATGCERATSGGAEAAQAEPAAAKTEPASEPAAAGTPATPSPALAEKEGVQAPASGACAPPRGSWYLHLSDVHLGTQVATQTRTGDTSVPLWDATKDALRVHLGGPNPPAFIVYTGDLPDHAPDRGEPHTKNIQAMLGDLRELVGSVPFMYLPGNNDSLDWDYAVFRDASGQTPLSVAGWSGPTLNLTAEGVPEQGYYSASPVPGLRVVALNTVLMSASYPCAAQGSSPGSCADTQAAQVEAQLSWLKAQLAAAGAAGQKVLLAMHIPPGIDAYQSPKLMWRELAWQDTLLDAIATSPAKVVGMAYGHTHLDELRRVYDGAGALQLVALSAPGITPGHGNNPGFKAVAYDAGFEVTDALTWYATAASADAPVYSYAAEGCYRYREVFGCEDGDATLAACLGAQEVCALATEMDTIYTVRNGPPSYSTATAVDVRPGSPAPPTCAG